jgi:hypothetical protein
MGLLDFLSNNDPQGAGQLAFGASMLDAGGPQSRPVSFGQALGQSIMGGRNAALLQDMNNRRNALVDMQAAQHQLQQQELLRQLQEAAQARDFVRQFSMTPAQQAVSLPGGPTIANAARIPEMPGGFDSDAMRAAALRAGNLTAVDLATKLSKPAVAPLILGEGQQALDPRTFKPLAANPKPTDPNKPFLMIDGRIVPNPDYQQYELRKAKAGASNVVVNNMDNAFGRTFAEQAAKGLEASKQAAQAAGNSLQTLRQMYNALRAGSVSVGPGANAEVMLRQVAQKFGVGGANNEEILRNTRELIQGTAKLGLDGAKAMQGQGQVSNYERELVQRASSGDISSMTAPELNSLIGVLAKVHNNTIAQHQSALSKVGPEFRPYVPLYQLDVQPWTPEATSVAPKLRYVGPAK